MLQVPEAQEAGDLEEGRLERMGLTPDWIVEVSTCACHCPCDVLWRLSNTFQVCTLVQSLDNACRIVKVFPAHAKRLPAAIAR